MSVKETVTQHRPGVVQAYEERRRFQRLRLQVPMFIRGRDAYGEQFLELAKTLDISAIGAFITSPRPLGRRRDDHPYHSGSLYHLVSLGPLGNAAYSGQG